jgi:molybdate transport system substrate-binding protein
MHISTMKIRRLAAGLFLVWMVLGAACLYAAEINVYAAASLSDVLRQISADYEKSSGDKLVFNFGASSFLARQISEGAPADIFFSADEAKMDDLQKQGLIVPGTRKSRLSNQLVIVTAADGAPAINSPADLAGAAVKRVAVADPKAVPAGIYAKDYLQKIKLWPAVEPKVIPTENVRAALAAVESGNVEAGIVYKTDAAISHKIKVVYEIPVTDGPKISYPMGIVKDARQQQGAAQFLKYLDSDAAAKMFEKAGFIVLK